MRSRESRNVPEDSTPSTAHPSIQSSLATPSASTPQSEMVGVLERFAQESEGNYGSLRQRLDQFSIFAGRNPLVCV